MKCPVGRPSQTGSLPNFPHAAVAAILDFRRDRSGSQKEVPLTWPGLNARTIELNNLHLRVECNSSVKPIAFV